MKKRVIWLIVSSLVILSIILASCAPAPAPAPAPTPTPTPTPTAPTPTPTPAKEEIAPQKVAETVVNALGKTVEKPRYGGTLILAWDTSILSWDRGEVVAATPQASLTHEEIVEGDWRKSAAGTGELTFILGEMSLWKLENIVPWVAESWEFPDEQTCIIHVRKGVRWANKPPMNGRELTADDVVFSLNRWWWTPKGPGCMAWPVNKRPTNIEALDKYTVKFINTYGYLRAATADALDWGNLWPRDSIEMYGSQADWRVAFGSGPFIVTDVVPGSSATFERNPNYWAKNPLYPEDTMPYIDKVKILTIPDISTRLAAMRTAKVDWLYNVGFEDALLLRATNPELKYVEHWGPWPQIAMRIDKPELPWYNKKVRHALQMAVNREEMKKELYKGKANIYEWPAYSYPAYKGAFVPMENLPPSVQELFQYKPEKAKQLLAEAGYPKGFKARVISRPTDVDMLSVIKEYWAKIGVDLEIQVREVAVHNSIYVGRAHEEMLVQTVGGGNIQILDYWLPDWYANATFIKTPETEKLYHEVCSDWFDWGRISAAWQEFTPYILDMATYISPPNPYLYYIWQPWLRDFNGEYTIGWYNGIQFPKYIWIDQDLKESMTGRR